MAARRSPSVERGSGEGGHAVARPAAGWGLPAAGDDSSGRGEEVRPDSVVRRAGQGS